jgi:predicted MPP superfamily phosphohydrolase
LGVWSLIIEPNRLVIHRETISLGRSGAQLNGLSIAVLSDIHAGSPSVNEEKLREIVARTNELNPYFVVILGDFMVRDNWSNQPIEPEVIASILKDLRPQGYVYAVLGNHDWWYDGNRVREALEKNGIKVLENEVAAVVDPDSRLWLAGLADAWTRPIDLETTLAQIPQGHTVIALSHNPDVFTKIPPSVALTLAGHTHGGQVNLPLLGRLVVPSAYGQRFAAGHIEEEGRHLFVTTGIGTSVFPIRFRVPPEIVLLTFSST